LLFFNRLLYVVKYYLTYYKFIVYIKCSKHFFKRYVKYNRRQFRVSCNICGIRFSTTISLVDEAFYWGTIRCLQFFTAYHIITDSSKTPWRYYVAFPLEKNQLKITGFPPVADNTYWSILSSLSIQRSIRLFYFSVEYI